MKTRNQWLEWCEVPQISLGDLIDEIRRDAFSAGAEAQRKMDQAWNMDNECAPLVDFPEDK